MSDLVGQTLGHYRVVEKIAEALEAAHSSGLVHRDLKPGKVKLRSDGTAELAGSAR